MYLRSSTVYNRLKYEPYTYLIFFQKSFLKPLIIFDFIEDLLFDPEPHLQGSTYFTKDEIYTLMRPGHNYNSNDISTSCLVYKLKSLIDREILHVKAERKFVDFQEILAKYSYSKFNFNSTNEKMFINTDNMKVVLSNSDYCKRDVFQELLDSDKNILKYFIKCIPITEGSSMAYTEITKDEVELIIQANKNYCAKCSAVDVKLRDMIEKLRNLLKIQIAKIKAEEAACDFF